MPWELEILAPAKAFLLALGPDEYAMFDAALRLLKEHGPNLREPLVKLIVSSAHPSMKELRRQSKGKIFRLLFAFDTRRRAVLLLGGDKAEEGFDDFYTTNVPKADDLFSKHLAECKKQSESEEIRKKLPKEKLKKRGKK